MRDTILLLEKENSELREKLAFAIDMLVLNHECAFCPMNDECKCPAPEKFDAIECTNRLTEFINLDWE